MDHGENRRGFFASRANMVLLVFLAVGGFYLVSEHWAHLIGVGPLLLLLGLCVGMHFFMHRGHGGHGSGSDESGPPPGGGREPDDHRH
ncbi:DUF2933 domain-containing protein [Indioceanicola profundi]|uniref:DUF2933 domain-containing protein n=1 Tax=Indioceanicola profundi TaxID=2220096 RepID=UPI000E6ADD86|nr:DUF2933 domain-containing protein [Indioceanicola profundi]